MDHRSRTLVKGSGGIGDLPHVGDRGAAQDEHDRAVASFVVPPTLHHALESLAGGGQVGKLVEDDDEAGPPGSIG